MDISTPILLLLLIFWIILVGLTITSVVIMWRQYRRSRGQQREPVPPPVPPPRTRRRQPPPPPIKIEGLTLVVKEPSKIKVGTRLEPETECLWPAATITVNDQNLVGRILPATFKIANPEGRIVYESFLNYTLKPGLNNISATDRSFLLRGRDDAKEGSVWEIQFLSGEKILIRAQFKIREDMVKKLKADKQLSNADGEFSGSLRDKVRNMEAPDLEDLIDK